jgi:hypothetical protein
VLHTLPPEKSWSRESALLTRIEISIRKKRTGRGENTINLNSYPAALDQEGAEQGITALASQSYKTKGG